jgi:hypothetical protein
MMHEIFLLIGAAGLVAVLILLRIRFSPSLHPYAKLFMNLLWKNCSENGTHET